MSKVLNNKFFKFVYAVFRSCFILIIVLYLSFIIIQRITGNKSIFGYRLFNVATGSMTGVYNIDDVIAVKDCDTKKLKVNDDVAYRGKKGGLDGLLITHRIIKIEEKEDGGLLFTTQGVNAPIADPIVEENQILGKVVGVVPIITPLNHIVKTQLGFFLLVFCPLVIVIVLEVLQTITEIKLDKNEIKRIEDKGKKDNNPEIIVDDDETKTTDVVSKNEEEIEEKETNDIPETIVEDYQTKTSDGISKNEEEIEIL